MSSESVDTNVGVDSRWWYWIVAYPICGLVGIPILLLLAVMAAVPLALLGIDVGGLPSGAGILLVLVAGVFIVAILLGLFVIFVLLPFALYLDANAIRESPVEWDPDPLVYALLAALQFFVTPIVGLIVAIYYLYQRHVELGVP